MTYKAIIFDLDGTAIPNAPDAKPSQFLIDAVGKAKDKIHLSAATGRPISNGAYILDALGLTDPCVISAGTQIVNPVTKEILWEEGIELEGAERVLEICKPYPYIVLIREELMDTGKTAKEITLNEAPNVMYVMKVNLNDSEVLLKEFDNIDGITASPVASWWHEGVDLHITHRQATKEHSIEELLKMLGVSKEETVGVGDGDNDIHLFKSVGLKVAMGNATDKIKSASDMIVSTVDEDGLAEVIEKYS